MVTLEEKVRYWYEDLPPGSLYSLKDFHLVFFEKYKESHPSLSFIENCCDDFHDCIQNMENYYGDEEFMDDEILETLYENPFHHQEEMVSSLLDENETEQDFNDNIHVSSSEVGDDLQ